MNFQEGEAVLISEKQLRTLITAFSLYETQRPEEERDQTKLKGRLEIFLRKNPHSLYVLRK